MIIFENKYKVGHWKSFVAQMNSSPFRMTPFLLEKKTKQNESGSNTRDAKKTLPSQLSVQHVIGDCAREFSYVCASSSIIIWCRPLVRGRRSNRTLSLSHSIALSIACNLRCLSAFCSSLSRVSIEREAGVVIRWWPTDWCAALEEIICCRILVDG